MILNKEEKSRIVKVLSWMIEDMKHKYDESKENFVEGSEGGYSPELTEAINLLEYIKGTDTIESTGCHRQPVSLNCREFECGHNRSGICSLAQITLESNSYGGLVIGRLTCVQAVVEKAEEEK